MPSRAIDIVDSGLDFRELHERMQWYVDQEILPCCATLVLKGSDVVDVKTHGPLDHETMRPLAQDSIFRMASCTKLLTSVAAMMLFEEDRFGLDDPIGEYLPEFRDMKVLKPGATNIGDTEAASGEIRLSQLLSHTAGLSYGFLAFNPESLIDQTYVASGLDPFSMGGHTLESMCADLAELPLAHQPGTIWRYSFATDIIARVLEVISGQRFDNLLRERIIDPLQMVDTDFYVPVDKRDRFTALYAPTNLADPMAPGYIKIDDPYTGSSTTPTSFLSGGGGLMSTLLDFNAFLQMLAGGGSWRGKRLLDPETLALMRTNQLPAGLGLGFPFETVTGKSFGLGFALKEQPGEGEPPSAVGEFEWGGISGPHIWISPQAGIAGICITQCLPYFWHPFSQDFKRLAYQIAA